MNSALRRQPTDYNNRDWAVKTCGLDLILCPGLGFTKEGSRIGRGKGYYDKYIIYNNNNKYYIILIPTNF